MGVESKLQEHAAGQEQALRWARVYRHAHALGLATEVQVAIENHIIAELGINTGPGAGSHGAGSQAESEAGPDFEAPLPDEQLWKVSAHHCELKLRQLVQNQADWSVLGRYAWHWLSLRPDHEVAARLVEFAYLYGDGTQAAEAALQLFKQHKELAAFYGRIHPAIRVQILLSQWRAPLGEKLLAMLVGDKDNAWLDPVERLCLFVSFCRQEEASFPYLYFRHYDKELAAGVKQAGEYLKVSLPGLYFMVARLAVKLGFLKEAAEFVKAIDPREPEYADALKLLHGLGAHQDLVAKSEWGADLLRFPDPRERLRLLATYFASTERGELDLNRLALNAVLADPLGWLPRQPELWQQLAKQILANLHQASALPNLLTVFTSHATQLFEPALDGALWQGFIPASPHTEPLHPYLAGVALLHCYLLKAGEEPESSLWRARHLVGLFTEANKPLSAPYLAWDRLQRWAMAVVDAHTGLSVSKKKMMLAQLRMCAQPEHQTVQDLGVYLKDNPRPPLAVLTTLQRFAASKEAPEAELQLIVKSASGAHLTNQDLVRLFDLASWRQRHDLAWRSASVLLARGFTADHLQQAWAISGENRKVYPWQNLQAADLDCCLLDFAPEESRLVWACLKLGTAVPVLLSEHDTSIQVGRNRDQSEAEAVLAKIDEHLAKVKWFGPLKKDYRVGEQGLVPAFAEALPSDTWSLLAATIAHRMGMAAWRWRLSKLRAGVSALVPRKSSWQMFQREQSPAAKWLRNLSPEQRGAWHDLVHLSQKIDDERAFRVLACFVCRLATVLYQHHHLALGSLRAMRAPVFLVWDLESWLLSEEYSRLRRLRGSEHKVAVPATLKTGLGRTVEV